MAILSEILALLDKWPEWKRVKDAPSRIDEIERRLAVLEVAPKTVAGEPCPSCGEPAMRRTQQTERRLGNMLVGTTEIWTCQNCGSVDRRNKNL